MMMDQDDPRWRRPSVYSTYATARDDFRNNRRSNIPPPFGWTTEKPTGAVLLKHSALREPHDLLWIPPQFCAPGVSNVQRRKNSAPASRMRFLIVTDARARALSLSLRVGVGDLLLEESSLKEIEDLHCMDLPRVETGQFAWVGLRVEGDIPLKDRERARAAILSIDSQRL